MTRPAQQANFSAPNPHCYPRHPRRSSSSLLYFVAIVAAQEPVLTAIAIAWISSTARSRKVTLRTVLEFLILTIASTMRNQATAKITLPSVAFQHPAADIFQTQPAGESTKGKRREDKEGENKEVRISDIASRQDARANIVSVPQRLLVREDEGHQKISADNNQTCKLPCRPSFRMTWLDLLVVHNNCGSGIILYMACTLSTPNHHYV